MFARDLALNCCQLYRKNFERRNVKQHDSTTKLKDTQCLLLPMLGDVEQQGDGLLDGLEPLGRAEDIQAVLYRHTDTRQSLHRQVVLSVHLELTLDHSLHTSCKANRYVAYVLVFFICK